MVKPTVNFAFDPVMGPLNPKPGSSTTASQLVDAGMPVSGRAQLNISWYVAAAEWLAGAASTVGFEHWYTLRLQTTNTLDARLAELTEGGMGTVVPVVPVLPVVVLLVPLFVLPALMPASVPPVLPAVDAAAPAAATAAAALLFAARMAKAEGTTIVRLRVIGSRGLSVELPVPACATLLTYQELEYL